MHMSDYSKLYRVNKPYLPIAAGDLSVQSAWVLVLFFAVAGLVIVGSNFGPFITSLYCLGLFLGTIYSVPPFRLKKYPIAAFLIIATVGMIPIFSTCFFLDSDILWWTIFIWTYEGDIVTTRCGLTVKHDYLSNNSWCHWKRSCRSLVRAYKNFNTSHTTPLLVALDPVIFVEVI